MIVETAVARLAPRVARARGRRGVSVPVHPAPREIRVVSRVAGRRREKGSRKGGRARRRHFRVEDLLVARAQAGQAHLVVKDLAANGRGS